METDLSRIVITIAKKSVYRLPAEIELNLLNRVVERFSRLADESLDE